MRVHHRNLTGLVGYCNEPTDKGLIYEYMGRGNLGDVMSGLVLVIVVYNILLIYATLLVSKT